MADDPTTDPYLKGSKLSKLLAGVARPTKVFRIEGRLGETDLAVRALSIEESDAAHADAMKRMISRGGWSREDFFNEVGDALFQQEMKLQVVARCLVDPADSSKPFAASADEARRIFEPDEVAAIFDEFTAFQTERSPLRHAKTIREVEDIADALGKGLISPTSLQRYDAPSLRHIITSLVAWARKRTRASSSDTSPPSDFTDDSSPETE